MKGWLYGSGEPETMAHAGAGMTMTSPDLVPVLTSAPDGEFGHKFVDFKV